MGKMYLKHALNYRKMLNPDCQKKEAEHEFNDQPFNEYLIQEQCRNEEKLYQRNVIRAKINYPCIPNFATYPLNM